VARVTPVSTDIDFVFQMASEKLDEVLRVATYWGSLDLEERMDFLLEWSVAEGWFRDLERASTAGRFSASQAERYRGLLSLYQRRKPMLDWIMEDRSIDPVEDTRVSYQASLAENSAADLSASV